MDKISHNDAVKAAAADFKRLRKEKKVSMKQVALTSGVSYSSVRRFERNGEISFSLLSKLADAIGEGDRIRNLFKSREQGGEESGECRS